jgi:hypothetical protein
VALSESDRGCRPINHRGSPRWWYLLLAGSMNWANEDNQGPFLRRWCTTTRKHARRRQRQKDGGVALRSPFRSLVLLSRSEIDRIVEFARSENEPPQLGRLQRYPCPDPATVERNWVE